jgi:hypothetical protein
VGIVPPAATAPALILVGSLMLATITEIRWTDPLVAVPSFLLHRQRPRIRHHCLGRSAHRHGKISPPGLAPLHPRRPVPRPLHLPGSKLVSRLQCSYQKRAVILSERGPKRFSVWGW